MAASTARADGLFRDTVAPVFQKHCLRCHNNIDKEGDFSLLSATALAESGYVEPGRPEDSRLLDAIGGGPEEATMPRDGRPLDRSEIDAIRRWIVAGAEWPNGFELKEAANDNFDWWSLKPLRKPLMPKVTGADSEWAANPIDDFVLRQHRKHGLTRSPQADKRTLIRRLTFDLIGLPPTPEEVIAFERDQSPDAYERVVDRLLRSEHYGERWAQHWLDVARYADTCGYDKDKLRKNAWPYRDYVVRSFNDDKPYSRFVKEQIAGDILYPGTEDGILGLGFIAAGPWDFIGHVEVPEAKLDGKEARNLDRDEMVSATMNAFCSTTVQCARCHNHKFDPITQEHYYSLQSVFAAVDRAERPYDAEASIAERRKELAAALRSLRRDKADLESQLRSADGGVLGKALEEVKRLQKLAGAGTKPPEFGYHSAIAHRADTEKWVQVDLGKVVELHRLVLHACHDDFAGIGAGFGFPVRFRVLVGNTESELHAIVERSERDFANPGLTAVMVPLSRKPQMARFIRIEANRLRERKNDFIMALAELEAIDVSGQNVAHGKPVTAKDTIHAPIRWRNANLTDGLWAMAADSDAANKLADAIARVEAIRKRLETPKIRRRRQQVKAAIRRTESDLKALPARGMVYAAASQFAAQGNFKPTGGKPREVRVLHRGNITQPKQAVQPGAIPLRPGDRWRLSLPPEHNEGHRRAALAEWIVSRENPLTWRSIVNRIWLHHFGRGLVATPNDFGRMGQSPSHPDLLDWLAVEFRDGEQSFRALHRLIVISSTYRQASRGNAANSRIDDDNRFLWRMSRRRLEAEELRDAVLAVSGRMNPQMGGPGFYLFQLEKTAHSPHYEYHLFDPNDKRSHRRSLYRFVVRSQPDPFMTTLDCADASQSTPKRSETLTSLQALALMNNDFILAMSQHFAQRLQAHSVEVPEQLALAVRLVASREPETHELARLVAHTKKHGLQSTCRLLLNLSEFCYLD